MTSSSQQIIRMSELPEILQISRATIFRLRETGAFPKPIQLGKKAIGFKREEIDAWIASRPVNAYFTDSVNLTDYE